MSVIKQRKAGVVIERSAVPVMDVVKAIGVGNEILDLKELYPVNDKEIWESINFIFRCPINNSIIYYIYVYKIWVLINFFVYSLYWMNSIGVYCHSNPFEIFEANS